MTVPRCAELQFDNLVYALGREVEMLRRRQGHLARSLPGCCDSRLISRLCNERCRIRLRLQEIGRAAALLQLYLPEASLAVEWLKELCVRGSQELLAVSTELS